MVKIGRTHTQDHTPLTLGQEWSAYAGMLTDDLERIVATTAGVSGLRSIDDHSEPVKTQSQNEGEYP